jgi:hypothetical protein
MKEIRIPMDNEELQDPQRITDLNKRLLAREFDGDMDAIHKHEVHDIIDDFDKGVRVIQIRKRKFYT